MITILSAATATLLLTIAWVYLARPLGLMDIPNTRSSHAHPVPRGGGVAILIVFSLFFFSIHGLDVGSNASLSVYIILPAIGMGLLGLTDDIKGLSPAVKLGLQFVFSAIVFFGFQFDYVPFGYIRWETGKVFAAVFVVLWISGFSNFFNFMDGIDGIAGGEAVIAAAFLAIHFSRAGDPQLTSVALLLVGCSLGFLAVNAPPAKVFMGDVGSLFLGFMLSALILVGSIRLGIPFWLLALPLYNFIVDPVYTLFRRVFTREKWYEAHRSHLYQRLVGVGWSHRRVTLVEMGMALMLGFLSLLPGSNYPALQVSAVIAVGFLSQILFLVYVINKTGSP